MPFSPCFRRFLFLIQKALCSNRVATAWLALSGQSLSYLPSSTPVNTLVLLRQQNDLAWNPQTLFRCHSKMEYNIHVHKCSSYWRSRMMDTAQHIVTQVAQGDCAAVEQRLTSHIKPFLSVDALQASWQGIEQQVGAFQEQGKTSVVQTPQGLVQVVTCIFERARLDVNVTLNDIGEIVGFMITPEGTVEQQANATYEPPPYAQRERFYEQEVQIGQVRWVLPATLSIPQGDGPFAAVLLVHGSGPQDRDETLPPNKPFRDLAWGLASQGIAVLRYDKRTKVYAAQLESERDILTVKEEVIDDALEAVALLRERPEIDAQQIFVLGHSLGGYLAPRLGAADPEIRGLIILAGSARPLEDLILEPMTYCVSVRISDPVGRQQQLAVLKKQVELVKDPNRLLTAAAADLPLNVPVPTGST